MAEVTPERMALLEQARWAARNAYAPVSAFRVGAVVMATSGRMFTGANIENQSLGLSICAERVAIFKAVSEGEREFTELAIVAETDAGEQDAPPCGACRQVMQEFSPGLKVTCRIEKRYVTRPLPELFPEAFGRHEKGV